MAHFNIMVTTREKITRSVLVSEWLSFGHVTSKQPILIQYFYIFTASHFWKPVSHSQRCFIYSFIMNFFFCYGSIHEYACKYYLPKASIPVVSTLFLVFYNAGVFLVFYNWRGQCNKVPNSIFHNFEKNAKTLLNSKRVDFSHTNGQNILRNIHFKWCCKYPTNFKQTKREKLDFSDCVRATRDITPYFIKL